MHARQADSALGGASGPNASADALTELLESIEDLLLCVKLLTVQPQVALATLDTRHPPTHPSASHTTRTPTFTRRPAHSPRPSPPHSPQPPLHPQLDPPAASHSPPQHLPSSSLPLTLQITLPLLLVLHHVEATHPPHPSSPPPTLPSTPARRSPPAPSPILRLISLCIHLAWAEPAARLGNTLSAHILPALHQLLTPRRCRTPYGSLPAPPPSPEEWASRLLLGNWHGMGGAAALAPLCRSPAHPTTSWKDRPGGRAALPPAGQVNPPMQLPAAPLSLATHGSRSSSSSSLSPALQPAAVTGSVGLLLAHCFHRSPLLHVPPLPPPPPIPPPALPQSSPTAPHRSPPQGRRRRPRTAPRQTPLPPAVSELLTTLAAPFRRLPPSRTRTKPPPPSTALPTTTQPAFATSMHTLRQAFTTIKPPASSPLLPLRPPTLPTTTPTLPPPPPPPLPQASSIRDTITRIVQQSYTAAPPTATPHTPLPDRDKLSQFRSTRLGKPLFATWTNLVAPIPLMPPAHGVPPQPPPHAASDSLTNPTLLPFPIPPTHFTHPLSPHLPTPLAPILLNPSPQPPPLTPPFASMSPAQLNSIVSMLLSLHPHLTPSLPPALLDAITSAIAAHPLSATLPLLRTCLASPLTHPLLSGPLDPILAALVPQAPPPHLLELLTILRSSPLPAPPTPLPPTLLPPALSAALKHRARRAHAFTPAQFLALSAHLLHCHVLPAPDLAACKALCLRHAAHTAPTIADLEALLTTHGPDFTPHPTCSLLIRLLHLSAPPPPPPPPVPAALPTPQPPCGLTLTLTAIATPSPTLAPSLSIPASHPSATAAPTHPPRTPPPPTRPLMPLHGPLRDRLAKLLIRQVCDMTPQQLTLTTHACSHLSLTPSWLSAALCSALLPHLPHLTPRQTAAVLLPLARMGARPPAPWQHTFFSTTADTLALWGAPYVTATLRALAWMKLDLPGSWAAAAFSSVAPSIPSSSPKALAALSAALTELSAEPGADLLLALEARAGELAGELSPPQLARVARALKVCEHRPSPASVDKLVAAATQQLHLYSFTQMAWVSCAVQAWGGPSPPHHAGTPHGAAAAPAAQLIERVARRLSGGIRSATTIGQFNGLFRLVCICGTGWHVAALLSRLTDRTLSVTSPSRRACAATIARAAAATPRLLQSMTPEAAAVCVHAIGALRVTRVEALMGPLLAIQAQRLAALRPQALSMTAWALWRLQLHAPPAWAAAVRAAMPAFVPRCKPCELANLCYAVVKLGLGPMDGAVAALSAAALAGGCSEVDCVRLLAWVPRLASSSRVVPPREWTAALEACSYGWLRFQAPHSQSSMLIAFLWLQHRPSDSWLHSYLGAWRQELLNGPTSRRGKAPPSRSTPLAQLVMVAHLLALVRLTPKEGWWRPWLGRVLAAMAECGVEDALVTLRALCSLGVGVPLGWLVRWLRVVHGLLGGFQGWQLEEMAALLPRVVVVGQGEARQQVVDSFLRELCMQLEAR